MKYAAAALLMSLAACGGAKPAEPETKPAAEAPAEPSLPPVKNGWREYPLRDGVISIQPAKWRTDVKEIVVPRGKGLEYKLTMKKGQGVVYSISHAGLDHPGNLVVEFHGHTPQVDGVGDLMFYSKTSGAPESGTFIAPWDGIHGWYLENNSDRNVVTTLELAGFYEIAPE